MQIKTAIFAVLSVTLMGAARGHATILPDACGNDAVKFKVKVPSTDLNGNYPDQPEKASIAPVAGNKARIVFVQVTVKQGGTTLFAMHNFTTRFGLNGNWVGAAGNNSFITVDVDPGVQHICASVQNDMDAAKRMIAADLFTAEAGKTYYYQFDAERLSGSEGPNYYESEFIKLNEDEGKWRMKALPLSIFSITK